MIVAGGGILYLSTLGPLLRLREARGWNPVPCVIVSSSLRAGIKKDPDDKETMHYRPEVVFEYSFGEKEFRSDRYNFRTGQSTNAGDEGAIVNRYPVGLKTVCYVNPTDPSEAVLDRSYSPKLLVGVLPLVCVLSGWGVLFYSFICFREVDRGG